MKDTPPPSSADSTQAVDSADLSFVEDDNAPDSQASRGEPDPGARPASASRGLPPPLPPSLPITPAIEQPLQAAPVVASTTSYPPPRVSLLQIERPKSKTLSIVMIAAVAVAGMAMATLAIGYIRMKSQPPQAATQAAPVATAAAAAAAPTMITMPDIDMNDPPAASASSKAP